MSTKTFEIPKMLVWNAWKLVRANGGTGGVDGVSIEAFENNLKNNLYRIWNRMSSGSYFPPAVRGVEIPKSGGGSRLLGIPSIGDRVAQTAVKLQIEARLDAQFLPDSYGYRPSKSAHDAIGETRKRCWKSPWVLEFDIRSMFDKISHVLVMKAVEKHVDEKWCRLYIRRWLEAEILLPTNHLKKRDTGTPQGGVISPVLANLFMHYAFDLWMKRNFPQNQWARFADDAVVHCKTKQEAAVLKEALSTRLEECGLEIHLEKTHIVYVGHNSSLRAQNPHKFTFLGFTFQMRRSVNKMTGEKFQNLLPAVSKKALNRMREIVRNTWKIRLRSDLQLEEIAAFVNPVLRGWFSYYGKYYVSEMRNIARYLDEAIIAWARRRFRLKHSAYRRLYDWLRAEFQKNSTLFVHWKYFKVY